MKKSIKIQSLSLIAFKGIKKLHIDFSEQNDIFGANGTGKTTIYDAFNWLLFGKDSTDRKDFEIKTLDANGKVIPKIEHEVSAVISIDGNPINLKRILRENWVKKRGSEVSEFAGNVTDLYWDDVPVNVTDFNKRVSEILNEQIFKMITSPTYFNSIEWKKRREILIDVAGGEVSYEDIAKGNSNYEALLSKLTNGKTIDEYNLQIKASIKKAKEDLAVIPTRIDEVNRQKPTAIDFKSLEKELTSKNAELDKIDGELANSNKAFDSLLESQKAQKLKVSGIETKIATIEQNTLAEAQQRTKPQDNGLTKLTTDLSTAKSELNSSTNALTTIEGKLKVSENELSEIEKKIVAKRNEWETENAKELIFDDADCNCPTCKQALPAGDIEVKRNEMLSSFKSTKAATLSNITAQGKQLTEIKESTKKEIDAYKERIENGKKAIEKIEKTIEEIKAEIERVNASQSTTEVQSVEVVYQSLLDLNNEYQELLLELDIEKPKIQEEVSVNNEELSTARKSLVEQIDNIKGQLNLKAQIESCDARIKELQEEEKTLSQQIANVEKEQFLIENLIREKIEKLETAINSKFKFVNFKMFDEQINGGYKETCEATVNGVPYSDVNTASKINAGLDVINTLCEFYQVSAPIFIDNAESVHTLIDCESQLIRLVVSESHTELTVQSRELVA
jgi:DNA repair exonuclease SbcCD ATPase subunit